LARVPFGSDSEGIKEMMLELDLYEQSVDLLEEFTLEGKAALVDTTRVLREAHTKALTEEAAAAELARLREEARLQAEKDAAAKAAKDAEDAEAVADALQSEALLEIKPAEVPAMVISDKAVAGVRVVVQGLARSLSTGEVFIPPATDAEAAALVDAQIALRLELVQALSGRTRAEVADALVDGTLHHAVKINWAAMAPGGQGWHRTTS
jgi:hypothetical protein